MKAYFDYTTFRRFKKAYETLEDNTDERIRHAVIFSSRGFSFSAYRFCRRKKIPYVSFELSRLIGLKKAIRFVNRRKFPITLTVIVEKKLSKGEKRALSLARAPILVKDLTNDADNLSYYRGNKAILYQTSDENQILNADFLHISRFGEPLYQCFFSDCLGNTLTVDKKGRVYLCPKHRDTTMVGTLKDETSYFETPLFQELKERFSKKQAQCESTCQHASLCMGACPLSEGCHTFPESFERADVLLSKIVEEGQDLAKYDLATVHTVLKDICYGEDFC